MKIINDVDHPKIHLSVRCANELLKNPFFHERICGKPYFDRTTARPGHLSKLIQDSNMVFRVTTFKPKGIVERIRFKKTLALTDNRYPGRLFLNENKLNHSTEHIAATIIHESIHALDQISTVSFGRGDDRGQGKGNTAPYWIGNLAYRILMHELDSSPLNFEDITVAEITVQPSSRACFF